MPLQNGRFPTFFLTDGSVKKMLNKKGPSFQFKTMTDGHSGTSEVVLVKEWTETCSPGDGDVLVDELFH